MAETSRHVITRQQLELAENWMALPENERMEFKRAIDARAAEWRAPSPEVPSVWPMQILIVQDPRVQPEHY
jgi:hypothetical protein